MLKYVTLIFGSAALFNMLVGGALFIQGPSLMGAVDVPLPGEVMVVANLAAVLIFVFGIGYLCVALDPHKNISLVWLGAVGKTAAIIVVTWPWVTGSLTGPFPYLVLIDLIYVVLFLGVWRALKAS
ncbi:MAG: hypothetical protein RLN89_00950 [Parvibaculum sp.]